MKTVIYKENGIYKTTNEANYNAWIQNARQIHEMEGFNSAEEIKAYYIKWFKCTEDDFIIIDN